MTQCMTDQPNDPTTQRPNDSTTQRPNDPSAPTPSTHQQDLLEAAKLCKPTILLGLSAVGGLFKEELIRQVSG